MDGTAAPFLDKQRLQEDLCHLSSNAKRAIILKIDACPGVRIRPGMEQPRNGIMALELVNSLLKKGLQNHGNTIYVVLEII